MVSIIVFSVITILYLTVFFYASRFYYKNFRDNDEITVLIQESIRFYEKELKLKNTQNMTINLIVGFPDKYTLTQGYVNDKTANYNRLTGDKEEIDMVIYLNHNKYSILETVAHEMIHVKQFNSGDLVVSKRRKIWKSVDHTKTSYKKSPWEIEAFDQEQALADKFFKHKGMKKPLLRKVLEWLLSI